jgi:hypothetical protein
MQTANDAHRLNIPSSKMNTDYKDNVRNLLARGSTLPCSAGAEAFRAMVPETSRFQVSLDILLPVLNDQSKVHIIALQKTVGRVDPTR